MGQILGLGVTHYPGLGRKGNLAARMKSFMKDPQLPEQYRDPATWPEPMQREWAGDEGQAHSDQHRADLIDGMHWARQELDRFNPDLVLISRLQKPSVEVMERQTGRWILLYQDALAQLWGRGDRFDHADSPDYLRPTDRRITDEPQTGFVLWPAFPALGNKPGNQLTTATVATSNL